jgi:diguanylate cyclase (GGDEF)-like protein
MNFGMIAGSITTLSTYRPAYLSYSLPQLAAIFVVFVMIGTPTSYLVAFAVLLSTTFMISASFNINRIHKNEVELTYNNELLINNLNSEIGHRESVQRELEASKRDLEVKVKERTKDLVETNTSLERVIEKKEMAEQSLQYLAYHDELTGLPNRNLLVDRVGQAIKSSSRDKQQLAILFLDLDRFKNINDSLGHSVGDRLLQEVSSRLFKTLREQDTISRNGGDEFVIVLERLTDTNEAVNVAKKIINCLTETFDIQSHKIHIGASIGISIYPTDGDSPLVLLRNADTAMYRAKQAGGNQLQFYDQSMSSQLRDRLELESELHNALENNEFYLVYQPQVNCINNKTTGFESLLRWNNEKYGQIGPDRFVPLLEETGLIYSVGEWVVSEVASFIRDHQIHDVTFSINLSALQCNNLAFVDYVESVIKKAGINPAQIEFEITETLLIKDFEKTNLFLTKMHSIGCTIALDDFGTGYTSMTYLARLPIDIIKIDKSLIRDIDKHENLKSIVKAIVTMSTSLGMKNIFEGIETNEELSVIKKMSGYIIQGYLISKPIPEEEVDDWLSLDVEEKLAYKKA